MSSVTRGPFKNTLAGQSASTDPRQGNLSNVPDFKATTKARPKKIMEKIAKFKQPTVSDDATTTTPASLPEIKNLMTARAMDLKPHLQNWGLSTTGNRDELAVRYLLHTLGESTDRDFSDQKWQKRGMELLVGTNMTRLKEILSKKGLDTKGKVKHEIIERVIGAEWDVENAGEEEEGERDLDLEAELEAALEAESEVEEGEVREDDDAGSSVGAVESANSEHNAGSNIGRKRKRDDPAVSNSGDEARQRSKNRGVRTSVENGGESENKSGRTSGNTTGSEESLESEDDDEDTSETEEPNSKRQKLRGHPLTPHRKDGFANPPWLKRTKRRPSGYAGKKPALVADNFPETRSRMVGINGQSSAEELETEPAIGKKPVCLSGADEAERSGTRASGDGSGSFAVVESPTFMHDACTDKSPPRSPLKRKRETDSGIDSKVDGNGDDGSSSKRRKRAGSAGPTLGDRSNSGARQKRKTKTTNQGLSKQLQEEDHHLIFGENGHDRLDTRVLFENIPVSNNIIHATYRILSGQANEEDATNVFGVRSGLPTYKKYCEGKFKAKSEQDLTWQATQQYWEPREMEGVRASIGDEFDLVADFFNPNAGGKNISDYYLHLKDPESDDEMNREQKQIRRLEEKDMMKKDRIQVASAKFKALRKSHNGQW